MFNSKKGFQLSSIMSVVTIIIRVLKGLLVPKFIHSPHEYGLYASIGLYSKYVNASDLGNKSYLNKRLPKLYANQQQQELSSVLNNSINFHLSIFAALALVFLGLSISNYSNSFHAIFFLLFIPYSVLFHSRLFLNVLSSSVFDFSSGFLGTIVLEVLSLLLIVPAVNYWGALGGFFSLIVSELAAISIFLFKMKKGVFAFKFSFNLLWVRELKSYIKQFRVNISDVLLNSYDLLLVSFLFSKADFGNYSLILGIFWALISVSATFSNVLFPRLMALSDDRQECRLLIKSTLNVYYAICHFASLALQLAGYLLILYYLPKYTAAIGFLASIAVITVVRGASILLRVGYIALNKENLYNRLALIYVVLMSAISLALYFQYKNVYLNINVIAYAEILFSILSASLLIGYKQLNILIKHFAILLTTTIALQLVFSRGNSNFIFYTAAVLFVSAGIYFLVKRKEIKQSFLKFYSEK